MYSRYVPNKLLIARKSRLLFTYNDDSIRDLTSLGSLRTFSESVVFRRNDRGVLIKVLTAVKSRFATLTTANTNFFS